MTPMRQPPFETPWFNAHSALFLDFDGTLIDLAESPDAVVVEPDLRAVLTNLLAGLNGAVAIVSGRPIDAIDRLLAPLRLPVAGVHGAERRNARGELAYAPIVSLARIEERMAALVARFPLLLVEFKRGALALHYRRVPEARATCLSELQEVLAACPGAVLLEGKMVIEIKPQGANKATAIRDFLEEPPFRGRRPVFAGDDVTDEVAFGYVQEHNGVGIKVGAGPSVARERLATPDALRDALRSAARSLLPES
jgi:trehalose 6-phosphate phosphatase